MTRSETPEARLASAQKASAEARAVADQAERALAQEQERLREAAAERMQAWASTVVKEYPAATAAAAEAVADARAALGRAILEEWPNAAACYLAWRRAASDGNSLVRRYSRALHELGQPQPTTTLYPNRNLNSLLEIVDIELAAACRLHDLEREDSLVAELDAVGQGRWEAPFGAHLAGCPGGALEVMAASKPSPVKETSTGSRVHVSREPATVVQIRRCLECGGQEQVTG